MQRTLTQCDFSGYLNYTICTCTLSAKGIYIMKLYFALLKIINYSCYSKQVLVLSKFIFEVSCSNCQFAVCRINNSTAGTVELTQYPLAQVLHPPDMCVWQWSGAGPVRQLWHQDGDSAAQLQGAEAAVPRLLDPGPAPLLRLRVAVLAVQEEVTLQAGLICFRKQLFHPSHSKVNNELSVHLNNKSSSSSTVLFQKTDKIFVWWQSPVPQHNQQKELISEVTTSLELFSKQHPDHLFFTSAVISINEHSTIQGMFDCWIVDSLNPLWIY